MAYQMIENYVPTKSTVRQNDTPRRASGRVRKVATLAFLVASLMPTMGMTSCATLSGYRTPGISNHEESIQQGQNITDNWYRERGRSPAHGGNSSRRLHCPLSD